MLAVGIAIIARGGPKYNTIIKKLLENERREELSVVLFEYVDGAVGDRIYDTWDIRDAFLGWDHKSSLCEPIMTKANTLILLDILYKDRKRFLKAWFETKAPALGGLLFVIWRCVQISKYVHLLIGLK